MSFFLIIIDLEIILRELLGLTDLTKAQALHFHKWSEVIIVNKDEKLIFTTFQVVALSVKSFNNNQNLVIMGFIPSFCEDYFLRKKSYWILLTNFGFRKICIFVS